MLFANWQRIKPFPDTSSSVLSCALLFSNATGGKKTNLKKRRRIQSWLDFTLTRRDVASYIQLMTAGMAVPVLSGELLNIFIYRTGGISLLSYLVFKTLIHEYLRAGLCADQSQLRGSGSLLTLSSSGVTKSNTSL